MDYIMDLKLHLDTADMSFGEISDIYTQVYKLYDYDWWYEIQPSDVVVDIGAGIGVVSKKALDAGASRVYMVEPNRRVLKSAIKNVSDYMIDVQPYNRVYPICATIGKDIDSSGMYQNELYNKEEEPQVFNLQQLITGFEIPTISYLRVDTAGGECNILSKEMIPLLKNHVKFIAVRVHVGNRYNSDKVFERWRDTFLIEIKDSLLFKDPSFLEKIWADNWKEQMPYSYMLYIKNW